LIKAFCTLFLGTMLDVDLVMAGNVEVSFVEKVRFEAATRQV
jgi:hypothetical protein